MGQRGILCPAAPTSAFPPTALLALPLGTGNQGFPISHSIIVVSPGAVGTGSSETVYTRIVADSSRSFMFFTVPSSKKINGISLVASWGEVPTA